MARRAGRKGTKEWTGLATDFVAVTTSGVLLATFAHDQAETVLRIRGEVACFGTPDAINDTTVVAVGAIVVSDAAVAAGVASIPSPIDSTKSPWIWHQFLYMRGVSATLIENPGDTIFRHAEIDSKAMRKSGRAESLVFVADILSAEMPVQVGISVRVLFLED